jgi:hypothetical protein
MSMTRPPKERVGRSRDLALAALCFAISALISGCGRNDIRVYTVPKEKPSTAVASSEGEGTPQVHWKTPAGWQEQEAEGMRLARFSVTGKEGRQADVAIIPLSGINAPVDQLVNIWREQMHLPALKPEELAEHGEKVKIGSSEGNLFEMASTEPLIDEKFKARSLVALLQTNGAIWIFKMSGHDDFVAEQKPIFSAFLASISIDNSPGLGMQHPRLASTNAKRIPTESNAAEGNAPGKPAWQVPAGWQEQPPSQMILAKFLVGTGGAEKAEVTVSAFPGDMGGLLANVNRWRGQVGLDKVTQADLSKDVTPVDLAAGKAMLVDVTGVNPKTGQKARLIGAIVPREGRTWFFKLMGDEKLAEKEKPVFVKFIQTVQFPDA